MKFLYFRAIKVTNEGGYQGSLPSLGVHGLRLCIKTSGPFSTLRVSSSRLVFTNRGSGRQGITLTTGETGCFPRPVRCLRSTLYCTGRGSVVILRANSLYSFIDRTGLSITGTRLRPSSFFVYTKGRRFSRCIKRTERSRTCGTRACSEVRRTCPGSLAFSSGVVGKIGFITVSGICCGVARHR